MALVLVVVAHQVHLPCISLHTPSLPPHSSQRGVKRGTLGLLHRVSSYLASPLDFAPSSTSSTFGTRT